MQLGTAVTINIENMLRMVYPPEGERNPRHSAPPILLSYRNNNEMLSFSIKAHKQVHSGLGFWPKTWFMLISWPYYDNNSPHPCQTMLSDVVEAHEFNQRQYHSPCHAILRSKPSRKLCRNTPIHRSWRKTPLSALLKQPPHGQVSQEHSDPLKSTLLHSWMPASAWLIELNWAELSWAVAELSRCR